MATLMFRALSQGSGPRVPLLAAGCSGDGVTLFLSLLNLAEENERREEIAEGRQSFMVLVFF